MKIFNKISVLLLVIFCSIVTIQPNLSIAGASVDVETISEKLKNQLIHIKTTKAGNGFDDLQPLKDILEHVHILGMGEATHGTKEFFEMKHRMFEFLVEEMGYRAFAIEAEFGSHQVINDYILNDKGYLNPAVKALVFWTWKTQEVADLIEWMREYNQNPSHKEKIRFYGFDMQDVDSSVQNIITYLHKVEPKIDEILPKLNKLIPPYKNNFENESFLEEVMSSYEENRDQYISRSSVEDYELVLQEFKVIHQYTSFTGIIPNVNETSNDAFVASFNARDLSMAENVKWIYEYEKEFYNNDRIMLWAHNGHIGNSFEQFTIMGEHLKNKFNDMYYSLGFDFYSGSLVTIGMNNTLGIIEMVEPDKLIFGTYFRKTGIPMSFLDFNTASTDRELENWLSNEHFMYSIGALLYEGYEFDRVIPNKRYDGIIYVEKTTAAESLFRGKLPKIKPFPAPEPESEPTKDNSNSSVATEQTEPTVEATTTIENDTVNYTALMIVILAILAIIMVLIIILFRRNKTPSS